MTDRLLPIGIISVIAFLWPLHINEPYSNTLRNLSFILLRYLLRYILFLLKGLRICVADTLGTAKYVLTPMLRDEYSCEVTVWGAFVLGADSRYTVHATVRDTEHPSEEPGKERR